MALNDCSSSVANAGQLLQLVLSNWHSNKCLLLNVKWDFWRGKEKCFFSSSMSHVYVDKKDTAWLPAVIAIQTSTIIHQASLTAKSPFLTLGRMNYECGISMVVGQSIPEAEWLAVIDPPAVFIRQGGGPGYRQKQSETDTWPTMHNVLTSLCTQVSYNLLNKYSKLYVLL